MYLRDGEFVARMNIQTHIDGRPKTDRALENAIYYDMYGYVVKLFWL